MRYCRPIMLGRNLLPPSREKSLTMVGWRKAGPGKDDRDPLGGRRRGAFYNSCSHNFGWDSYFPANFVKSIERRERKSCFTIIDERCLTGKRPTKSYHHISRVFFSSSESRVQVRALLYTSKANKNITNCKTRVG